MVATSGRDALVLEVLLNHRFQPTGRWRPLMPLLTPFTRLESQLWAVGPGGTQEVAASHLPVSCAGAVRHDELPVCAAFDGTRTRLFTVDADARRLTPVGWLPDRFIIGRRSGNGWLTGWWKGEVAVRLDRREVARPPELGEGVAGVGATDDVIATASGSDTESHIRLYVHR
jgi:hypothetical protein